MVLEGSLTLYLHINVFLSEICLSYRLSMLREEYDKNYYLAFSYLSLCVYTQRPVFIEVLIFFSSVSRLRGCA